jgi:DNA (cytosine-5)-methyltransferase 1
MHSVTLAQAVIMSDLIKVPDSSLLRTPSAIEGEGGAIRADVAKEKNRMLMVRDQMAQLAADNGLPVSASLLATPTTQGSSGICRDHGGDLLHDVTCGCARSDRRKMLPTPVANEGEKATNRQTAEQRKKTGQVYLTNSIQTIVGQNPSVLDETNWGQFEPAIRRWERIIGRPAPAPTEPTGKDGNHRLAAKFTEWMMGLDDGHVTNPTIGITRNEQLKACGNGVCPQQAEMALRILLGETK